MNSSVVEENMSRSQRQVRVDEERRDGRVAVQVAVLLA